jgi:enamine deaminase RidA (YjgF/YER057c/UK114 family)
VSVERRSLGTAYQAGKPMPWGKGVIASGRLVFLSGATGRDPETDQCEPAIGDQAVTCWEEIRRHLEEAGTSCENIVQRNTFVTDVDEWMKSGLGAQERWLHEHCPALLRDQPGSALIGVARLALPEMKVEIQVIAVIPDRATE